jgi:hypothetical protein
VGIWLVERTEIIASRMRFLVDAPGWSICSRDDCTRCTAHKALLFAQSWGIAQTNGNVSASDHQVSRSTPVPSHEKLGTLAHFRGHTSGIARYRVQRGQRARSDRGAMLDGADHRRFIHAIGISHGRETLLAAHTIDHALLPSVEHGVRENGEVAEHPKQIYPLQE